MCIRDRVGSTDSTLMLGVDYDFVQTTVTGNTMILNSGDVTPGVAGPSGLAGIQIIQTSVVPVPGAIWLFMSALGFIGWIRRKHALQ